MSGRAPSTPSASPSALGASAQARASRVFWSRVALITAVLVAIGASSGCAGELVAAPRTPAVALASPRPDTAPVEQWEREFEALREHAVPVLTAMSDYSHFLVFVAESRRLYIAGEPAWDPPMDPAWGELPPLIDKLSERAAALHTEVSGNTSLLPEWRFRRALAEATRQLVFMTEAMQRYYSETTLVHASKDDDISTRTHLNGAWDSWGDSKDAWDAAKALEPSR